MARREERDHATVAQASHAAIILRSIRATRADGVTNLSSGAASSLFLAIPSAALDALGEFSVAAGPSPQSVESRRRLRGRPPRRTAHHPRAILARSQEGDATASELGERFCGRYARARVRVRVRPDGGGLRTCTLQVPPIRTESIVPTLPAIQPTTAEPVAPYGLASCGRGWRRSRSRRRYPPSVTAGGDERA